MLAKLYQKLVAAILYPMAVVILTLKSEVNRLRSMSHKPVVHFEAPPDGRPILVFAFYQGGKLRPDTERFLRAAKAAGFFVLGVNTRKLRDAAALGDLLDCYIERYNFGRDFGSYRTAFRHIYRRKWDAGCPRLLMMNDSVFVDAERSERFVNDMLNTQTEVLGATENFEIEYHLGSFCIAIAENILRSRRLRAFWANYRNSDVRPTVIRRGEMALSRTLKACATSDSEFGALYGTNRFFMQVRRDPEFLQKAVTSARVSDQTGWETFSFGDVAEDYLERYLLETVDTENVNVEFQRADDRPIQRQAVRSVEDLATYLRLFVNDEGDISTDRLRKVVAAKLTEVFMSGSQIHQNAAILLEMGLPIVKLDGLYRGMFIVEDIETICSALNDREAQELQELLLQKPFGGNTLVGWKKAAFMRGLL